MFKLGEVEKTYNSLRDLVIETPILPYLGELGKSTNTNIYLKLELFQHTGSFKIRGALSVMRNLDRTQLSKGVTAFSGGNHAIAVAYAAKLMGTSAKVVMPSSASISRVEKCRAYGAEVILVENRSEVPSTAEKISQEESRVLVPPFDHPHTLLGTASLGYELHRQLSNLDYVFLSIGGGGLAAGVSTVLSHLNPNCKVVGVQPESADAMYRSLKTGIREKNENVNTVADSLCPPLVGALTFEACQRHLHNIVRVKESDLKQAMRLLFDRYKLVVEGAGSLALAGCFQFDQKSLADRNVAVIVSGSNIDPNTFLKNSEYHL